MARVHAFAQAILIARPLTVARRSLSPEQTATATAKPTPRPTADICLKPPNTQTRSRMMAWLAANKTGYPVRDTAEFGVAA
jgi:hypothetical protein